MPRTSARRMLSRFIRLRGDDLKRFLRGRLLDPSEVEDVAQEAYLRVLRLAKVNFIHDPEAYLFRIAANVAYEYRIDQLGARQRNIEFREERIIPDEDQTSMEDAMHHQALVRQAMQAMEGLSPQAKAAVTLYWRDGMSVKEVAATLHVTSHTVKKYLATALVYCRDHLRDQEL